MGMPQNHQLGTADRGDGACRGAQSILEPSGIAARPFDEGRPAQIRRRSAHRSQSRNAPAKQGRDTGKRDGRCAGTIEVQSPKGSAEALMRRGRQRAQHGPNQGRICAATARESSCR